MTKVIDKPLKTTEKEHMADMQSQPDHRRVDIDKVGVKGVKYPIRVLDKTNESQHTIANINMYVDLPHQFKGTHMSRFVEILNEHSGEISVKNFSEILERMKEKFDATEAHVEVSFTYFINKEAPVSKQKGLMEYECKFTGSLSEKNGFIMEVNVPVTTLCPCSKEISERGAHNQRSIIKAAVKTDGFVWLEDVISILEGSASAPVYSLLKRVDEKYVTEEAYDNPRFVEDVVRDVVINLEKVKEITWVSVEVENFESIHNHSAYASIEKSFR